MSALAIDLGPVSDLAVRDFAGAMIFSLLASTIAYVLYGRFYGNAHVGAGVNRTFILGGPAITTLFISIQFSLPLSLGLLGALSFVRFRTPVKDPAEIGFLLLVIASSVGAATYNYGLVLALYAVAIFALVVQKVAATRWPGQGPRDLVITVRADDYGAIEPRLWDFLDGSLRGVRAESHSTMDGEVSIHLIFRDSRGGERWGAFSRELNAQIQPACAEVFVN